MGVRILLDATADDAALYCSTSCWAFGPVFHGSKNKTSEERAEAFLRWLRIDPRGMDSSALERKYVEWLAQEAHQYELESVPEAA